MDDAGDGHGASRPAGVAKAAGYYIPLNSSQAATILPRPKSEGRKIIAQCASTGDDAQDGLAPERGVRIRLRASFAPFRGWLIGDLDPGLCALG